ncbi:hypothetical protein [Vibrio sp. PID23_8]|uniref:hypothetical protein n=1 Tax=Vibrio sp. PID23_8 TaxID=1583767 RepID=UPI000ECFEADD|nr:hypothetical protein AK966_07930 [Vibrio sp. PID23_8]
MGGTRPRGNDIGDAEWSSRGTLPYTTRSLMDVWVDHQYGGGVNPKTTKAFHWGKGYYQFDHALVGTLASGSLNKTPVTLYYAIKDAHQP